MTDQRLYAVEPFFLPLGQESVFCLFLRPADAPPRAAILYLPPFAEEMHKSRRMASLQAQSFARAGYAVLLVDLLGCGDSSGDFEEASWEAWQECGAAAYAWLKTRAETPVLLWGLRLGAALAVDLSARLPDAAGLILWQPVTNGENFLNQFLRIRIASEMLADKKIGVKDLRGQLAAGDAVEIGGYMLSPALAASIDTIRLGEAAIPAPVCWLEIAPEPSPASLKVLEKWAGRGVKASHTTVAGDPFWSTVEITECPGLLAETLRALEEAEP